MGQCSVGGVDSFVIPDCKVTDSIFQSIVSGTADRAITGGKVVITASTDFGFLGTMNHGSFNLDLCQPDSAKNSQGVELYLSGAQCPIAINEEWSVEIDILIMEKFPLSSLDVEVKAFDQNNNEFMCMNMNFDIRDSDKRTCTPTSMNGAPIPKISDPNYGGYKLRNDNNDEYKPKTDEHYDYYGYIIMIGVIAFILINNVFVCVWCLRKNKVATVA